MNRIVIVSNRVQVPSAGEPKAGGLAVALDGLMMESGGLWFGWSGRISEDSTHAVATAMLGKIQFATIDLTRDEHERYYNGFSNSVLWPLLHSMPEYMNFDRRSATVYRQVNARITDALAPLLRPTDIVWIHDYHLMAMPALLRDRGVTAPVGFFLHVPFPAPDMLASVPEAGGLIRDLLAADLLGFQTANDVENFANAAERLAGASRIPSGQFPPASSSPAPVVGEGRGGGRRGTPDTTITLMFGDRRVRVGVFPVEIDAPDFAAQAGRSWRTASAERLRRSLQGQQLILGVDRLDPTKGLPQRLAGYRRLLETRPDWRRRVTLLQIAAESRKEVAAYQDLRTTIDAAAGAINGDWGEPDWTPVRLIARAGARNAIAGTMREARVGLVTPLRDGMNLVAKEYIAAQDPQDPGVLILSRFAGAARQLRTALLVNPHDPDELAEAMDRALTMSLVERQDRWRSCWAAIERCTPAQWGRNFLDALLAATAPRAPAVRPLSLVPRLWPTQPRTGGALTG